MERRQASKFYPHFNQEERPVIDYFTGLFNQLIFKHEPILTDFLDTGKRAILRTIVGNDALSIRLSRMKLNIRKNLLK